VLGERHGAVGVQCKVVVCLVLTSEKVQPYQFVVDLEKLETGEYFAAIYGDGVSSLWGSFWKQSICVWCWLVIALAACY